MAIGENKEPDLKWNGDEKTFVKAVERLMKKHGFSGVEAKYGKVTHIFYEKEEAK